jgi:hypothetical protein
MTTPDRIFPLCELLLGAAYADRDLHKLETIEVRSLLTELSGLAVDVEIEDIKSTFTRIGTGATT